MYPNKTVFIVTHSGVMNAITLGLMNIELTNDPNSNIPLHYFENCQMVGFERALQTP